MSEISALHFLDNVSDDNTDALHPATTAKGEKANSMTALRIIRYPLLDEELEEGRVQLGEHADWGSITLLVQDDVPGLEVQTVADGDFILAQPMEGLTEIMAMSPM